MIQLNIRILDLLWRQGVSNSTVSSSFHQSLRTYQTHTHKNSYTPYRQGECWDAQLFRFCIIFCDTLFVHNHLQHRKQKTDNQGKKGQVERKEKGRARQPHVSLDYASNLNPFKCFLIFFEKRNSHILVKVILPADFKKRKKLISLRVKGGCQALIKGSSWPIR